MCLDLYAPRHLCARGGTNFSFKKKIKRRIFFKKKFVSKAYFFDKTLFPKKAFCKQKSFIMIKMLISSKLLLWHLCTRIVRIEIAGKGAAIEKKLKLWLEVIESMRARHLCTILKLYTNSFCQQRVGLEILIKVTSKADRLEGERKKFYKNWFFTAFLSIIKNVFHYMFAKFSNLIWMHAISSPWSQILRCTGTSCLCELPAWAQIRATKNFSYFWSLPYIWEKNIPI